MRQLTTVLSTVQTCGINPARSATKPFKPLPLAPPQALPRPTCDNKGPIDPAHHGLDSGALVVVNADSGLGGWESVDKWTQTYHYQ